MKLILALATAAVVPAVSQVTAHALTIDPQFQEVYDLLDGNISEMTEAYEEEHGVSWKATKIEDITNIYSEEEEQIGYLVLFDEGYLAYSNELSVYDVSPYGTPSYYTSSFIRSNEKLTYKCGGFNGEPISTPGASTYSDNNIFYALSDYYYDENFKINYSMVQIPFFKDIHDSSDWGNYQGITFTYIFPYCGALLGTMSLMYTLKVNNIVDLTPYQTSYYTFMKNLEFYIAYNSTSNNTSFVNALILFAGINNYLDDYYDGRYRFAQSALVFTDAPATTLYYDLNSTHTAEYTMRVGHCQTKAWWVFYNYYDIVMANSNNFYRDSYDVPIMWYDDSLVPYYVVDQNYRDSMFHFFEDGNLLM